MINLQIFRWKPTKRNYTIAKEVDTIWGIVDWVLDAAFFYYLGAELWWLAGILFFVSLASSYLNTKLHYWIQEQIGKDKVEHGKRKAIRRLKNAKE